MIPEGRKIIRELTKYHSEEIPLPITSSYEDYTKEVCEGDTLAIMEYKVRFKAY